MGKVGIDYLRRLIGAENVKGHLADLYVYGSDASVHQALPAAVVRPQSTEQVCGLLRYANEEGIAVVPRGGGSGMCSQTVPVRGGMVLDMKAMNRILEINTADGYCRVEPGVVDDDLNLALKPYGFFYPATPASRRIATIGGEIANNASGMRSVKYGTARGSLLALRAALPSDECLSFGSATRVAASGYPLERLLVGSEGTLAVVVEATLRFVPLPKVRALGVSNFEKLEHAGQAISAIMAAGCQPSMLELIDKVAITAVNKAQKLGLPDVEAILLFEAAGMVKEAVDFEIQRLEKLCRENGGTGLQVSYDAAERERLSAGCRPANCATAGGGKP